MFKIIIIFIIITKDFLFLCIREQLKFSETLVRPSMMNHKWFQIVILGYAMKYAFFHFIA